MADIYKNKIGVSCDTVVLSTFLDFCLTNVQLNSPYKFGEAKELLPLAMSGYISECTSGTYYVILVQ